MSRQFPAKYMRMRSAAIIALMSNPSITVAAAACGISDRGLRLWMTRKDFQEELRNYQRRIEESALARLTQYYDDAIRTLHAQLNARKSADRTRAANSLLRWQKDLSERDKDRERLAELEKTVAALQGKTILNIHGDMKITVAQDAFAAFLEDARSTAVIDQTPAQSIDALPAPIHGENGVNPQ